MLIHRSALHMLEKITTDDTRYALQCVHVRADGLVEATDGHILLRVTGAARDAAEYPACGDLDVGKTCDVLVPGESIKKALRLVPKRTALPILEAVAVVPNGEKITLAVNNLDGVQRVEFSKVENTFPDTDAVIKRERAAKPKVKVALSVDVLRVLCDALAAADVTYVTLAIGDPDKALAVEAKAPEMAITGLLMPARS